jgi:hypothetical protein
MLGKGERGAQQSSGACCCACEAREAEEKKRLFLSPILWCIFAVAKGFTERKDLLGTPFFGGFFLKSYLPGMIKEPKADRQAGRQA